MQLTQLIRSIESAQLLLSHRKVLAHLRFAKARPLGISRCFRERPAQCGQLIVDHRLGSACTLELGFGSCAGDYSLRDLALEVCELTEEHRVTRLSLRRRFASRGGSVTRRA